LARSRTRSRSQPRDCHRDGVRAARYKFHPVCAAGLASESVKEEFAQHAREEAEHLDLLAERINQSGGKPDLNPGGVVGRAATEYIERDNLVDMIKENLIAGRIAIECWSQTSDRRGANDAGVRERARVGPRCLVREMTGGLRAPRRGSSEDARILRVGPPCGGPMR